MRAWSGGGAARARGVGECVRLATGGAAAGSTVAATGLPGPAVCGHAVRGPASAPTPADPRVVSRATPHLTFTGTISSAAVTPDARMSITFDVVPKKGMYVFAPGTHYRPVAIRLDTGSLLRVHGSKYPKPTRFVFKPLKEEVLVYDAPFRLALTVVAGDAETLRSQLRGRAQMTIKGTFDYQACDDSVCYEPASVPVQWILKVAGR